MDKCKNCGAELENETGSAIKCAYCGSVFETATNEAPPAATPLNEDEESFQPVETSRVNQAVQQEKNVNSGAVIIICVLVLIGLIATIHNYAVQNNTNNTADSAAIDSAALVNKLKKDSAGAVSNEGKQGASAKFAPTELSPIVVDAATFRKLYRNARKKHDQFSGNTFIYDQSSPRYVNINGIFAYISKEDSSYTLRFTTQYTSKDWLFIKNMTFNAGGENFDYAPDFKRDSGDGAIWEWSDEEVPEPNLSMLVRIAISKKAKVRYDGDKYYDVVTVTRTQQAALKRQLQIYKGLLLGYDRPSKK
ncbi:zinc ribbon domain-containing protein [Mucilaginibacter ginsenosidivorax]|uniref:Uncharacterized protein n=1 Tax=Mucilaginibacter ginsenosidivorax TaxID=862126 RepID=A0A5B8VSX5_9SPHI|nr:hypothetical protein [Mucilaginibacter ginsenosidivorax]QEC74540.1 hypothetical protein FSB76_00705 [Mucilaginibacter ginsenosidivorax]